MPGSPFAARTTPDGRWALVSVSQSVTAGAVVGSNGIVVLERTAATYRYVSFVPLQDRPSGLALNRDGTLLLAAANRGVAFIDVQRAVTGALDAVPGFEPLGAPLVGGTIEVTLSADERFQREFIRKCNAIMIAHSYTNGLYLFGMKQIH
jgi:hypothetical protein